MNTHTHPQTDTETSHMSLQPAHFFPHFYKMGKYLLPLLAGLFILAACGGGGAAPTTVEPTPTTGICETNLFDTRCDAPDVETKRNEKIEECITGNAVGTATCKDARDANTCLEDPFDEACTADTVDADFAVHLEPAKAARETYCRQGNNNIDDAELCGNAVTTLCSANPFDTVCFPSTTYRDMRIAACSRTPLPDNSATVCTTQEITQIVCAATGTGAEPFNITICGANDGVMSAVARQEFCRTNLSDNLCTTTISTFCATIDDADKFTDSLCGTPASAAVRGAYCVGLSANIPSECGDDDTAGSLVRAYCEGGGAALSDTNNCATTLGAVCETAPFGHACTSDKNITDRAEMCRNNQQGNNSCDSTITAICEGKINGGNAITANIFDPLCAGKYDVQRQAECMGEDVSSPATEACRPVISSLCTAEPFNAEAGAGDVKFDCLGSATYTPARNDRNTFCRTAPNDGTCTRARTEFCGTPDALHATNDIFDNLCDVGFDTARTLACATTPDGNPLPSAKCGSEITTGYLFDYCGTIAGDSNKVHCPTKFSTSTRVRAVDWETGARDATDTNDLVVLPAITGTSDPIFSYVQGGADGLERGDDYLTEEEKSNDLVIDKRNFGQFDFHQTLRLSELAGSEDTSSGVAFRQFNIRNTKDNLNDSTQTYAGILSNTDVGAPISDMNPTVLLWDARLELVALSVLFEADFTMEVNFGDKTIKTRDMDALAVVVPRATTRTVIVLDSFSIDGKFTDTGVIYGTTTLTRGGGISTGSLTGLIGDAGAVGVFFSNDSQKVDAGTYVGGFVAVPTSCEFYPFGAECTSDADIMERLRMCNDDININGIGGCTAVFDIVCRDGNIGTGGGIESNPSNPLCVGNALTDNVDTARLKRDAVDTDGTLPLTPTGPLTILTEVGAYDADENYVQAGADELNRGFLVDDEDNFIGNPGRLGSFSTLDLSDVGLLDDTASGVKPERYVSDASNPFISRTNMKFYVGILSGTDLGAPLTAENTAEMIWSAKLIMVDEYGFNYRNDFTLEVNFTDKTINTADPIDLAFSTITTGTLTLTGKFTADGVIYGTSQLKLTSARHPQRPNEELTSDGSLTGLIGEKGAVGAFISKSALDSVGLYSNTAGRYAGGFVARNPNVCVLNPFSGYCDDEDSIIARADMCRDGIAPATVTRANVEVDPCIAAVIAICANTNNEGNAINPFHEICNDDNDTYADSRRLSCVRDKTEFGGCTDLIKQVCLTDGKLFDDVCAGTYDDQRQMGCIGQRVDEPSVECRPVILALCNAEPLNPAAGVGDAKFDCAGANNYRLTRQARITLCSKDAERTTNPLCTQPSVLAITDTCPDDPFDTQCDDYAVQYREARETRLSTCRGDRIARADVNCTGAASLICDAGDSPFASVCGVNDGRNNVQQRVEFCKGDVDNPLCPATITAFCRTAKGADLFLDICNTGTTATAFIDYRVAACRENDSISGECPGIISTNCTGTPETDSPACAPVADSLPTAVWKYNAPNADNTGRLNVLEAVGLDDAYTNYIEAIRVDVNGTDVDILDFSVLYENGALDGTLKEGVEITEYFLQLSDVAIRGDDEDGVTFALVNYDGFTDNPHYIDRAKERYYAGLFANTDLGGPLIDASADGIWVASFAAIVARGIVIDADTTMIINFDDKTIETRDDDDPVSLRGRDIKDQGLDYGTISIAGEFTDAGVIFGTSTWTLDESSSTGTVSGLIGKDGAVGAFVSSGENIGDNTDGEFVGGFVAARCEGGFAFTNPLCKDRDAGDDGRREACNNPNTPQNSFVALCAEYTTDEQRTAFAELCRMDANIKGCDRPVDGISGLTVAQCADNATGNPYQTGCEGDVFDDQRTARNLTCGATPSNTGQCLEALNVCFGSVTNTGCDVFIKDICDGPGDSRCANTILMVCTDQFNTPADPLSGICDTGYEVERQNICATQDVTMPDDERCLPVFAAFCEENPFNTAQSPGRLKFDCLGSDTYHVARKKTCELYTNPPDFCTATIDRTCDVDKEYFSQLCFDTSDENFETYENARIGICTGIVDSTNNFLDPGDVSDDCHDFIIGDCSQEPFEDKCYIVDNRDFGRLDICSSSEFMINLDGADATPAHCNRPELAGKICGSVDTLGTDPFALICAEPTAVAADFVLLDVQHAFCRDGANINGAVCADTVANFCDVASGADLFDGLCTTGNKAGDYLNYRVAACREDSSISDECRGVIFTNCEARGGPTSPACASVAVPTAVWKYTAPNADNTGRLNVLEAVGLDDAYTNYIEAIRVGVAGSEMDVLDFSVLYENGALKTGVTITEHFLQLSDVGNRGDDEDGVTFALVNYNGFTDNPDYIEEAKERYYAGLFANTDLGGPLIDASADGIWVASFAAIVARGVVVDTDTTMIINFNAKTINTRDVADPVSLYAVGDEVTQSLSYGSISIAGEFTDAGVIFGRSTWTMGTDSSSGTLSGLIGKDGAVGAFVSSGENIGENTQGEYVGGFVTTRCEGEFAFTNPLCENRPAGDDGRREVCNNPKTPENSFVARCATYTTDQQRTAFAELCRLDATTTGCDNPVNGISGITIAECADNATGNPYQTGCEGDVFDDQRMARDLTCTGNDVYDATQCSEVLDNCFGSVTDTGCDAVIKLVCDGNGDGRCGNTATQVCGADPFNIICENDYLGQRQNACATDDIANPTDRCAPVITTLCTDNPFNAMAGDGTSKIDCTAGDTYLPERVVACETTPESIAAGSCEATRLTACAANPFYTLCEDSGSYSGTYQGARDTACRASPGAYGLQCDHLKMICATAPNVGDLDICRDDERYAERREVGCAPNSPSTTSCAYTTIAYRCRIDPLNPRAGLSFNKYNCAGLGEVITRGETIDADGNIVPVGTTVNYADVRSARVLFCKNPDNSQDARCMVAYTQTFLARCAEDPFNSPCRENGNHFVPEQEELIADCRHDDSLPQCDVHGIRTRLCTTAADGTPFAPFCDTSDFLALRGTALRVAYCNLVVDGTRDPDPRCAPFADEFCSNAVGNGLFNSICTTGVGGKDYDFARVAACRADITVDTDCPTIIADNCNDGDPFPECAIATSLVWDTYAVNSDGTRKLTILDEIGTDDPEFNYVLADADGLDFSVLKDEGGNLKTGVRVVVRGLYSYYGGTYEDTTSGVAFAFTRIGTVDLSTGGQIYSERYYAGILSGTDLGGPVADTAEPVALWPGIVSVILDDKYYSSDFGLTINYEAQTFNAVQSIGIVGAGFEGAVELAGSFNDAGVLYGTSKISKIPFAVNGDFPTAGASLEGDIPIPGTSLEYVLPKPGTKGHTIKAEDGKTVVGEGLPRIHGVFNTNRNAPGTLISTGSVTGLIGDRGALGVFVADGKRFSVNKKGEVVADVTGAGSYVGGFVADNPNESPDCSTATGKPFDLVLCPNADEVRRDACINRGTNGENLPTGVTESDCNTPELVALICRNSVAILDPLCADDLYDAPRQLICGGQDVNNPAQPLCAPVIEKLCTAEPFNRVAGPGANKFDCTSVNSEPVIQARNTRIALCLADATKDSPLCKQGHVPVALASCADNPDGPICRADGIRAALTVCSDNPNDLLCKQSDVRAALTACSDNPRGLICTQGVTGIVSACEADPNDQDCRDGADEILNFCSVNQDSDNQNIAICDTPGLAVRVVCVESPLDPICTQNGVSAVLTACPDTSNDPFCTQEGVSAIVTACVINPQSPLCLPRGVPSVLTTCAADPLDAVCTDVAEHYTQARVDRLETCRGKASTRVGVKCDNARQAICAEGDTPFAQVCAGYDETQATIAQTCATDATPADSICDTPVSGAVKVKDCIENPYNAACPESVFYPARAAICESEATSFTAGCLTDGNFASTYASADGAREAQEALIARCADSGNTDKTNCDTPISGDTTLAQCIENPFLTDCAGTETLARCRQLGRNDCSMAGVTTALMTYRNAFVARCADSGNTDKMGCDGVVNDGKTIASCITAFNDNDCARSGAFNAYRGVDCTIPANAFAPLCQGGIGEAVITARAELALSCAVTAGGTGCNTIVSGSLTVDMCNTNPFATGCEDAAFANVRFEMCKTAEPKPAACGVKEGQRITSYVQGGASGLELGDSIYKDEDDLAVYREDDPKTKNIHEGAVYEDDGVAFDDEGNPRSDDPKTPIDESKIRVYNDSTTVRDESKHWIRTDYDANDRVLREGIEQGSLTLNDLVDATDNENHGFAYAYIPGGRGADDINGWDRYYAGLLSGTDVGASITADAMWNGKVSVVNGTRLTETADFVLTIDFNAKTLTSGDIAVPRLGGYFVINGKFTTPTDLANSGVIYGATRLYDGLNNGVSSIGSVTGLIGSGGAVGAFVSSGAGSLVNTFGEYAGGFVASSDAPTPDCSTNLLNADCIANDAQYYDICVTTAIINSARTTEFCAPIVERYIARETECASADLSDENDDCAPVLAQLCDFNSGNIFKTEVGTGTGITKFDCTKVTKFNEARAQICRDPVYANGGAIVKFGEDVYETDPIPACVQIITDICAGDPFTQTVKTTLTPATNLCGSSYDDDRKTACMGEVSRGAVAPARCFDTIQQVCNANPFDDNFCFTSNLNYTATRLRLCYADMGVSDTCTTVISTNCPDTGARNVECHSTRFTAWADSFNTDDSDAAVASIPADEPKKARILLGRANGLDTKTNVTSIHAPHTVLRFEEGYSIGDRGNIIGGEGYESGIAVFSARTTGSSTIGHYAGILSGTDVGLPITDPAVDATWDGDMAWVSDDGAEVKRAYKFTLNVNFVDGSISGSGIADSLGRRVGANDILSFNAKWNGNGILTGTTALRINILDKDLEVSSVRLSPANGQGILTGMIGNQGAVGVFASNDDATVAYAGGFIAKPKTTPAEVAPIPPTATIWATRTRPLAAGAFTSTGSSRYGSYFITGLPDGLGLNKDTGVYKDMNVDSNPELVLRLDEVLDDDMGNLARYNSGFAVFFGNIGDRNKERYFTGLLSGTTVGDNLPYRVSYNGEATAIWGGVIGARFGHQSSNELGDSPSINHPGIDIDENNNSYVTDTNFQIEINFEALTIKTPTGAGKGAFYAVDLRLEGEFDRSGIMSGTVTTLPKSDETLVDTSSRRTHGDGTFTGIIGQDAAIGVFNADRGAAQIDYFGYAGGFIATPCAYDIFNKTCPKNADPVAITAYCNDTTANAGKNVFNVGCNKEADIETRRTTACASDRNLDETCPGLLVTFCEDTQSNTGSNPWTGDACAMLSHTEHWSQLAFNTARDNACLNFGTAAHKNCSNSRIIQLSCLPANPYAHVGCNTAEESIITDADRRTYCLTPDGLANAACPNANTADWVASFTDLNTDPDTTATAKNEFLQIVDKTISTTGTTMASNDAGGTAPTPTTLDFSQITLATPSMALNTDDGLAYFSGYQGSTLYYYAGIFGSTDLGAPIDADITATWTAMLSINGTETIFDLDVVFDGAEGLDNTVKGFITNPIDTNDLLIDGTFTANGVIEGDVHYAVFADETTPASPAPFNGTLSGLISTEGAVAVFVGTGYSGGFVAVPDTVNFADWQGSFDGGGLNQDVTLLAPGTNVDGRLMNSAWFIELNVDNEIVVGTQTITDPTILRLNDNNGQEGYKSGVAFWHGDVGATPQYYAGLLPTTDLGAPLTDVSKNGTWTGTIAGITNGDVLTNTEVKFEVMFSVNSNGTIKSIANEQETYTYAVGANTVGAVNVKAPNTDGDAFNNTFDFTGEFNAQGVITGTVAHTNGELSQNANGTFNGLIGVDGAVGVFKSNNNNRAGDPFGYIGGFVATPPSAGN